MTVESSQLDSKFCQRLERTFDASIHHTYGLLFMHSIPVVGHLYFKAKGYDRNLYHIISSLYSISAYSKATQQDLEQVYQYLFQNKNVEQHEAIATLLQALTGFETNTEEKTHLLQVLQHDFRERVLMKSGKSDAVFLADIKKALNRLLHDSGQYSQYHIKGEERKFYDVQGEEQSITVYDKATPDTRGNEALKKKETHRKWKFYAFVAAMLSAAIVGPGQGIIAANGFYQSTTLIAQMVTSIPVLGHLLGSFFTFLALNPVALITVAVIIFLSSSFTNFFLFGADAYDTLVRMVVKRNLFDDLSSKQTILGVISLVFAFSMGFTIAGLTLYSMLNLIVPLAAATFLPLGLLQVVTVFVTGFTFASVSLVMISALVSKIRNSAHKVAGRYLLNLFLPFVHIFKLGKSNSDIISNQFKAAAEWDASKLSSAEKWTLIKTDTASDEKANVEAKKEIIKLALHNLMNQYKGTAVKEKLGLTVKIDYDKELTSLANAIANLNEQGKEETFRQVTNQIDRLIKQFGCHQKIKPQEVWNQLKEILHNGPILTKTQRQQYEWAQAKQYPIEVRALNFLLQLGKVSFFVLGLAISALACFAMAIAWRQASSDAMVYFHMASQIAENLSFIIVYVLTAPVIAMFFGAGIIKLFSETLAGTASHGFAYTDSARTLHKKKQLSKEEQSILLQELKEKGPTKATFGYYVIHTISYAVVGIYVTALLINAVGNALVSLISGDQFQHNLGIMHIHFDLLTAECIAFTTAFFASWSVNFFSIRQSMQTATPHMSTPVSKLLQAILPATHKDEVSQPKTAAPAIFSDGDVNTASYTYSPVIQAGRENRSTQTRQTPTELTSEDPAPAVSAASTDTTIPNPGTT